MTHKTHYNNSIHVFCRDIHHFSIYSLKHKNEKSIPGSKFLIKHRWYNVILNSLVLYIKLHNHNNVKTSKTLHGIEAS